MEGYEFHLILSWTWTITEFQLNYDMTPNFMTILAYTNIFW